VLKWKDVSDPMPRRLLEVNIDSFFPPQNDNNNQEDDNRRRNRNSNNQMTLALKKGREKKQRKRKELEIPLHKLGLPMLDNIATVSQLAETVCEKEAAPLGEASELGFELHRKRAMFVKTTLVHEETVDFKNQLLRVPHVHYYCKKMTTLLRTLTRAHGRSVEMGEDEYWFTRKIAGAMREPLKKLLKELSKLRLAGNDLESLFELSESKMGEEIAQLKHERKLLEKREAVAKRLNKKLSKGQAEQLKTQEASAAIEKSISVQHTDAQLKTFASPYRNLANLAMEALNQSPTSFENLLLHRLTTQQQHARAEKILEKLTKTSLAILGGSSDMSSELDAAEKSRKNREQQKSLAKLWYSQLLTLDSHQKAEAWLAQLQQVAEREMLSLFTELHKQHCSGKKFPETDHLGNFRINNSGSSKMLTVCDLFWTREQETVKRFFLEQKALLMQEDWQEIQKKRQEQEEKKPSSSSNSAGGSGKKGKKKTSPANGRPNPGASTSKIPITSKWARTCLTDLFRLLRKTLQDGSKGPLGKKLAETVDIEKQLVEQLHEADSGLAELYDKNRDEMSSFVHHNLWGGEENTMVDHILYGFTQVKENEFFLPPQVFSPVVSRAGTNVPQGKSNNSYLAEELKKAQERDDKWNRLVAQRKSARLNLLKMRGRLAGIDHVSVVANQLYFGKRTETTVQCAQATHKV